MGTKQIQAIAAEIYRVRSDGRISEIAMTGKRPEEYIFCGDQCSEQRLSLRLA
jgi:hypothetical protein